MTTLETLVAERRATATEKQIFNKAIVIANERVLEDDKVNISVAYGTHYGLEEDSMRITVGYKNELVFEATVRNVQEKNGLHKITPI